MNEEKPVLCQSPLGRIEGLVPVSKAQIERLTGEDAQRRMMVFFDKHRRDQAEGRERMAQKVLF